MNFFLIFLDWKSDEVVSTKFTEFAGKFAGKFYATSSGHQNTVLFNIHCVVSMIIPLMKLFSVHAIL